MCHVAGRIFFPGPGIEPTLVALEVPNLNLWTREVLTPPFSYMANLSASNLHSLISTQVSVAAARGLRSCGLRAPEDRFSSCDTQA